MNINLWFSENYQSLKEGSIKISGNHELADDLLQYTIVEMLEKKNIQDIVDSGGALFYAIRIMMNSFRSTTSPFYRTYRKISDNLDDYNNIPYLEDDNHQITEERAKRAQNLLDCLPWYDQQLFKVLVNENHTISSLSRSTKIPRSSVSLTINRIKKHIKSKL